MEANGWKGILCTAEEHSLERRQGKALPKLTEPPKGDFSLARVTDSLHVVCVRAYAPKEHSLSHTKLTTAGRCLCSPLNPACHPALPKCRSEAHWILRNHTAAWGSSHTRWQALPTAMVPAPPPQKTSSSVSQLLLHENQSLRGM